MKSISLLAVLLFASVANAVTFTSDSYHAKNDVKTYAEVKNKPFDLEIEVDSVVQQGGLNWFTVDASKTTDGGDTHASTYFTGGVVGTLSQWTLTDYISAEARAAAGSWAECSWRNNSFLSQTYWANYDGVARYKVEFIGNTPSDEVRHPQFQKYKSNIDPTPNNELKFWFDGNTRKWRVQGTYREPQTGSLIGVNFTSGVYNPNQQFKYTKTTYHYAGAGHNRYVHLKAVPNSNDPQQLDTSVNGDSEYDGYNSLQVKRTGFSVGNYPY